MEVFARERPYFCPYDMLPRNVAATTLVGCQPSIQAPELFEIEAASAAACDPQEEAFFSDKGLDERRIARSDYRSCEPLLSAENQLGGAARNHMGRRVCPRPRYDLWHHRRVRHA